MLLNKNFTLKLIESKKIRYVLVGAWNTLFGYFLGVILFLLLNSRVHIVIIAIIANIIAISMSFVTYKILVFKTTGSWLPEYLRCYIVYGFNALLGTLFLWLMVDGVGLNIWIAQGLSILATVFTSYFLHKRFTFRST
jgi:putative flippase GtrA